MHYKDFQLLSYIYFVLIKGFIAFKVLIQFTNFCMHLSLNIYYHDIFHCFQTKMLGRAHVFGSYSN